MQSASNKTSTTTIDFSVIQQLVPSSGSSNNASHDEPRLSYLRYSSNRKSTSISDRLIRETKELHSNEFSNLLLSEAFSNDVLYEVSYPIIRARVLPNNLRVKGSGEFHELVQLPENFTVTKDLYLVDCSFSNLPKEKINLGGSLDITNCKNLKSLPDWITKLGRDKSGNIRHVSFTNTGLSNDLILRFQNTEAPGMKLHFERTPCSCLLL